MKMAIRISNSSLRYLCIKHKWCTGMTIKEYGELLSIPVIFEDMKEAEKCIAHIAEEIIRTSDFTDIVSKANVMTSVFAECVSIWWESDKND